MSSPFVAKSITCDAKENLDNKMAMQNPAGEMWLSRGHFFHNVFFCVTHNGASERGTTRSLTWYMIDVSAFVCCKELLYIGCLSLK